MDGNDIALRLYFHLNVSFSELKWSPISDLVIFGEIPGQREKLMFRKNNHFFFASALNKEFLDIQETIECGLTLKPVHEVIRTYSHIHFCSKPYNLSPKHHFSLKTYFLIV